MKTAIYGMLILFIFIAGCSNDEDPEAISEEEDEDQQQEAEEAFLDYWHGAIEVPNQELNIDMNFTYNEEDEFRGFIDIPAQNLENYPLEDLEVNEEQISFEMDIPNQYIRFEGELVDEDHIEGEFTQQGDTFPFHLNRGEREMVEEDEEDEFESVETSYGELRGELIEASDEPGPVAIIIPGSGPTDRNGNGPAGNNNSLKLVAEGLEEQGISSLRYSKRGVKENAEAVISEQNVRFHHFVGDANTWVNYLREDERFTDVYLIGHSQGALVAMLAAQQSDADKVVSLAGAGRSIDEVLFEQMEAELSGQELAEAEAIIEQLKEGQVVSDVSMNMQGTFRPDIQPFLISWMAHKPEEVVEALEANLLIVQGGRDLQVSLEDAERLADSQPNAQYTLIEEMNHVLKEAPENREGNLATYQDPTLPIVDGLIEAIVEFLSEE